jgi:hypothetical protein
MLISWALPPQPQPAVSVGLFHCLTVPDRGSSKDTIKIVTLVEHNY